MKIALIVNDFESLDSSMTTWMLAEAAAGRGHEVVMLGVASLSVTPDGDVCAAARRVADTSTCEQIRLALPELTVLSMFDVVLIRTNPGRDPHRAAVHEAALVIAQLLEQRGILVLNRPAALQKGGTKLSLFGLPPRTRPETLVSSDLRQLLHFVERLDGDPCVLKPLRGTRGGGGFRVDASSLNLRPLVELLTQAGPVMIQDYLFEAEDGDVRVILVDGEPLEVDGEVCAVRRVPGRGDFRSNVHAGGLAVPAELTPSQRSTLATVGPILAADGQFLVGVDLVGDRVIELNVFSPGGFADAHRFTGVDFTEAVIARIESRRAQ